MQPDGKILAGGEFTSYNGQPYAFTARLLGGVGAGFSATPDPVGFGEQQTGSTSGTLTVTVTNTGSAPLTFAAGAVTLGGDQPGQFSLGEDTCAGGSVPAAGTCTVKVRFAPTSTGVKTATLRFASNAAGSPHVVALTGTGTTPVTPPPPPQPQTVGAVVKKLKPKKKASLPRTTQQGAALTWKTATKKVCTVKGSKVTAKRKGTCKLKATAPAITDFLAYTGSAKIKVK